jgi:hypothetical protein
LNDLLRSHTEFSDHSPSARTYVLALNKSSYDRLPRELKSVIDSNSGQVAATMAGAMWDQQAAAVANMVVERGDLIVTLLPEAVARWRKATEPVIDAWRKETKELKIDGSKLIVAANVLLAKYANTPEPQAPQASQPTQQQPASQPAQPQAPANAASKPAAPTASAAPSSGQPVRSAVKPTAAAPQAAPVQPQPAQPPAQAATSAPAPVSSASPSPASAPTTSMSAPITLAPTPAASAAAPAPVAAPAPPSVTAAPALSPAVSIPKPVPKGLDIPL